MGGDFTPDTEEAEWNMLLDPHAAAIVYRSAIPSVRAVGQEITKRVAMDEAEVRDKFSAPILAPILDYVPLWFQMEPLLTFHDPIAAAMVLNESICTLATGVVDVEMGSGVTRFKPDSAGPHRIAVDIDPSAFFTEFANAMEN
jgi:purine nucleosidase